MVAASLKQHPELSDAAKAAIQRKVRTTYKDYPLEMMVNMNTVSLAGEVRLQTRKS